MSKKGLKRKIDFDVTGKDWRAVVEADPTHIRGLSQKAFAKATSRLVSAYNKRMKRLEQAGMDIYSPAYRSAKEQGKERLSVKGKSYNDLMKTYADAKRFLTERKTSSLAGTRSLKKKITERIGHEFKDENESKRYWEAIDKLKEKDKGKDPRTSTDVQREVADKMFNEGKSVDEILEYYDIIIEAETPNIDVETGEIYDFGGSEDEGEEDEEGGLSIFDDDWIA